MTPGAFRDIETLRQWFYKNEAPYWTLYIGREMERGKRIAVNTGIKEIDKAWQWLEELLIAQSEGGGTFHIHAKDNPKEDADQKTLAQKAQFRLTSLGYHAVFEISNSYAYNRIPAVAGMPQSAPQDIDKLIEEKVNERIERYELESEIEGLQNQIQDLKKSKNSIMGFNIETLPSILQVISAIKGLTSSSPEEQKQLLGVHGLPPESTAKIRKHLEDNTESDELSEDENNKIDESIERISVYFPDIAKFMESLANYIEKNPELSKSLFNSLS